MNKKLWLILFFVLPFLHAEGANTIDSVPAFSNTASFGILNVLQEKDVYIDCRNKPLTLFVFLSPECPLCQNYSNILNGLQNQFSRSLQLYGVVPGNAYNSEDVKEYIKKYKVTFDIGIDNKFLLTKYLKGSVTPQVVLIDSSGQLIYKGAIDDWVTGLGKKRQTPSVHYVADAIQQYLDALPVKIKYTRSYGCKINDI